MHKYLVRHLANKSKLPDKLAGSGADRQPQKGRRGMRWGFGGLGVRGQSDCIMPMGYTKGVFTYI